MTIDISDMLTFAYWALIVGAVVWWVRSLRRAGKPRPRSPQDQAELARVTAAVDRELRRASTGPAA